MGVADRPAGKLLPSPKKSPDGKGHLRGVAQQQHGQDIIEGVGFFFFFLSLKLQFIHAKLSDKTLSMVKTCTYNTSAEH